jgi:hypothetical protein
MLNIFVGSDIMALHKQLVEMLYWNLSAGSTRVVTD